VTAPDESPADGPDQEANDDATEDPVADAETGPAEVPPADESGDAGDAADEAPAPFGALLALQDLDTAISQLEHRIDAMPERASLREVEQALDSLTTRAGVIDAEREVLGLRLSELERELEASIQRKEAIERRMLQAGLPPRDLQAMDAEVRHLVQRRMDLEDQQLMVMEDQEPLEDELTRMQGDRERLGEAAMELGVAIKATETAIGAEISAMGLTRGVRAGELPADLLTRYEALRVRMGGTGAARLVGNHCDGCHLELPSVEVERIRRLPLDEVVTCEQCGRILVRTIRPRR
jgi:predicted  nucleic acid-binding Zn-ribbon protein